MRTTTARPEHGRRPDARDPADTAIGTTIRTRRTRLGIHQAALADRAGIDRAVLSRIERGERCCRVTELAAIAGALRIRPENLLKLTLGRGTETAA